MRSRLKGLGWWLDEKGHWQPPVEDEKKHQPEEATESVIKG